MTATILLVGASHSRTPARTREGLHLATDDAAALSRSLLEGSA